MNDINVYLDRQRGEGSSTWTHWHFRKRLQNCMDPAPTSYPNRQGFKIGCTQFGSVFMCMTPLGLDNSHIHFCIPARGKQLRNV